MAQPAKAIKEQIVANLQTLQTNGVIQSFISLDQSANPLTDIASDGLPLAIIAMPRVDADFEDQANNIRTYRYDILFVLNPSSLQNPATDVEDLIDAALNEFDTNFTLAGTAVAAILPATVETMPVSTGDNTLLCVNVTLKVRTLYTIGS